MAREWGPDSESAEAPNIKVAQTNTRPQRKMRLRRNGLNVFIQGHADAALEGQAVSHRLAVAVVDAGFAFQAERQIGESSLVDLEDLEVLGQHFGLPAA